MISIIVAALKNGGVITETSDFAYVKFNRMSIDKDTQARYWVMVYDHNESQYILTEVLVDLETMEADFVGCPELEGTFEEVLEAYVAK
ncbi:hypothetical protein CC31p270 [Enterobacter phage CC31]|uniref:Uncharacterized protein n=1 Tax=Enterobacter phage CC31 TaxID=709484 RepID=E5DI02_9CAUD|nr:hypothetical protein CC31p270 [Enterobacter phage CC31]ADB81766.1 hypothetical protein CC31p270 [Enterobacter phage CC31]